MFWIDLVRNPCPDCSIFRFKYVCVCLTHVHMCLPLTRVHTDYLLYRSTPSSSRPRTERRIVSACALVTPAARASHRVCDTGRSGRRQRPLTGEQVAAPSHPWTNSWQSAATGETWSRGEFLVFFIVHWNIRLTCRLHFYCFPFPTPTPDIVARSYPNGESLNRANVFTNRQCLRQERCVWMCVKNKQQQQHSCRVKVVALLALCTCDWHTSEMHTRKGALCSAKRASGAACARRSRGRRCEESWLPVIGGLNLMPFVSSGWRVAAQGAVADPPQSRPWWNIRTKRMPCCWRICE